ncbi:hypothetical protein [Xanthomonas hortorum]|uniref:hypothetical protein n=1 Tax=Xanthomonas hortorum TaxID=56454 RepID=UPI0021153E53|nr:hypothetical protein [Xanthomonas hortorum]UUF02342.1 hypothetical protein NDY25_21195 [Xanthomonas hortorum pv. pelargonii]
MRKGEQRRIQHCRQQRIDVAAFEHHHREHPQQHQQRRQTEGAGHAAGAQGDQVVQRADAGAGRQQQPAPGEQQCAPWQGSDRTGWHQAQPAQHRGGDETHDQRTGQQRADQCGANEASPQQGRQADRQRQHHFMQIGLAVAQQRLRKHPGPGEEQEEHAAGGHQVDQAGSVARNVGAAHLLHVVGIGQAHQQIAGQADENQADNAAAQPGAQLRARFLQQLRCAHAASATLACACANAA